MPYKLCVSPFVNETARLLTNDKIDLRTKAEGQILVAHELVHFDGLYDAVVRDSLS